MTSRALFHLTCLQCVAIARKEDAHAPGGGGGSSSGGGGSSSKGKGKAPNEARGLVGNAVGVLGQALVALPMAYEGDRRYYGGLQRCLLMHT